MLNLIRNIKLSLTQWLLVSMSAAIGLLVIALKIQGSRLHKAQIEALKNAIKGREDLEDEKINRIKERLKQEVEDYEQV